MAKAPGMSHRDRLKQLDDERTQLLANAKSEALDNANEAVAALNELGFNYRLVEGGRAGKQASGGRTGTRTPKDAPCPICGFKTEPPHDKRSHRSHPQSFSDAELKAKGWKKVS